MRVAITSLVALAMGAGTSTAGTIPELLITVAGPEKYIYNYQTSKCETWDVPDAPTRGYKDSAGVMHIIQTTFVNRKSTGTNLYALNHDCHVTYQGQSLKDVSAFDHHGVISAVYTLDGVKVNAIIHNEFWGNQYPDLCPDRVYMHCWYNTLVGAVSTDNGKNYTRQHVAPLNDLIAAIPYTYAESTQITKKHAGVFEPTNIIKHQGYYYFMANEVTPFTSVQGNIMFRTQNLDDVTSWRVWKNGNWDSKVVNPYGGGTVVKQKLGDRVGYDSISHGLPWQVRAIVRHLPTGIYVAIMLRAASLSDPNPTGVFYSTSRDLFKWDGPKLLYEANTVPVGCGRDKFPISVPGIIDPLASGSKSFETVTNAPVLTYIRMTQTADCKSTTTRDVMGRAVRISLNPDYVP